MLPAGRQKNENEFPALTSFMEIIRFKKITIQSR